MLHVLGIGVKYMWVEVLGLTKTMRYIRIAFVLWEIELKEIELKNLQDVLSSPPLRWTECAASQVRE